MVTLNEISPVVNYLCHWLLQVVGVRTLMALLEFEVMGLAHHEPAMTIMDAAAGFADLAGHYGPPSLSAESSSAASQASFQPSAQSACQS